MPLRDGCIQTIITSPPYWGLRDYGLNGGGIGQEPTLDGYIENMRAVGRELWRVLRDDGTMFLNIGDCYTTSMFSHDSLRTVGQKNGEWCRLGQRGEFEDRHAPTNLGHLKPKDLIGLPWRVAFALQADGWYLRSDIIWAKPNPMPEPVRDRPTRSHEYIFLLTKRARYFYDAEAVMERAIMRPQRRTTNGRGPKSVGYAAHRQATGDTDPNEQRGGRNRRTVWNIATQPYRGAHFATFPEKLVEPCILAGTSPKACGVCGAPWERVTERERPPGRDTRTPGKHTPTGDGKLAGEKMQAWLNEHPSQTVGWCPTCDHNDEGTGSCLVLDPFCGSGTVGAVARRFGRRFVGCDLSAVYLELARERIGAVTQGMRLL